MQLCTYFHLCRRDCIYCSFEDEAELHTLCKDSQIAKRKKEEEKGTVGLEKQTVSSVLCERVLKVRQSIPAFLLQTFGFCVLAAFFCWCLPDSNLYLQILNKNAGCVGVGAFWILFAV